MAAAAAERLVERAAQSEKKVSHKKEAMEAQAAEKRARREALRQAFFAARADMAATARQRKLEQVHFAIPVERQGYDAPPHIPSSCMSQRWRY